MAVGDRTNLGGTAYDRLRILTACRNIAKPSSDFGEKLNGMVPRKPRPV